MHHLAYYMKHNTYTCESNMLRQYKKDRKVNDTRSIVVRPRIGLHPLLSHTKETLSLYGIFTALYNTDLFKINPQKKPRSPYTTNAQPLKP